MNDDAEQQLDRDILEAYRTSTPEIRRRIREQARRRGISPMAMMRLLIAKELLPDDREERQ